MLTMRCLLLFVVGASVCCLLVFVVLSGVVDCDMLLVVRYPCLVADVG